MSRRIDWTRLKARERGLRSVESALRAQRGTVGPVLRAFAALGPTVPIRWTQGKHGEWLVRGPLGLTGDIEVTKRVGGTSRVTIERLLWSGDGVALYRVRRF